MTFPLDTDDLDRTPPQTESAEERGFRDDEGDARGTSESDDEGDIGDEGPGLRG